MKLNKAGFTLVEILAALVILGILMGIALPNVVGNIQRQRVSAYVEDAKRLVMRAKTTFATKAAVEKIQNTCFTLEFLDNGDFEETPNGGTYLADMSYVRYTGLVAGSEHYVVTLIECTDCSKGNNKFEALSDTNSFNGIIEKRYHEDLIHNDNINSLLSTVTYNELSTEKEAETWYKNCETMFDDLKVIS